MSQSELLRPILGQPNAVLTLENALQTGRLAGSYLFAGPDGVGKRTTAVQFAKHLCGAGSEADPAAQAIAAGTFSDFRLVEPMGPSRTIRIGQLWPRDDRENPPALAMLRDLHFEPLSGPRRVFLILDAEGLNESSGNSLLKILEEPPPYAHFLLTAASLSAVLPTIISRCQVVRFGLLAPDAIAQALESRLNVAPAPARFLAALSEGRLGRACILARSPALLAGRDRLLDVALDLATAPAVKSFKLAEEFRKAAVKAKADSERNGDGETDEPEKGVRELLARALDLLATVYRDLLAIAVQGPGQAGLINLDRRDRLAQAAGRYRPEQLERALTLISGLRHALERNANAPLVVEVLFTQLTALAPEGQSGGD